MRNMLIYSIWLILISCSASSESEYTPHDNWPDRSVLRESFRQQDTAIIVYAKENYAIADLLINGLSNLQQASDRFTVVLRRDDEITESEVKNYPLYVIGTEEHLLMRRLSGNIPAEFAFGNFTFNNKVYNTANDLLKISFFPNVFNPNMPLTVIFGNHEEVVVQYVQQELQGEWGYFFWDSWGYQVYHNGHRSVVGNFSDIPSTKWAVTEEQHWEFDFEGKPVAKSGRVEYIAHNNLESEHLSNYDAHIQQSLRAVETFCNKALPTDIQIHLFKDAETKAMQMDNADQTIIQMDPPALYTVIDDEYTGRYDEKPAMLALEMLWGTSGIRAIQEGLAIHLTENWMQTNTSVLAGKLLAADAMPGIAMLIDNEAFLGESDYLMHIAASSFVDYLLSTSDASTIQTWYSGKQQVADLLTMQQAWYRFVDQKAKSIAYKEKQRKPLPEKMYGFNFAHEGYQIYNGYMGSEADRSIAKLAELGCNTIAVIPYSTFRSMDKPGRFHYTEGAGMENDQAILHSCYQAAAKGMITMVKPQLWSWLGWTGDITMQNANDWNAFFEYYEEWIMHYALFAEIYDIDILCVGTEFQAASLSQHAQWDAIFDKVRKVYSGYITYAANWGREFEQVDFWDKLDFVSVNCYYPLASAPDPSDAQLLEQFEANLTKIEKVASAYKKPVFFTEIGFKSISQPWLEPHKDADEYEYSEAAQRRCYSVMQKAMLDESWIQSVYLWKWPSYMGYAEDYTKDFNPCGKEAEQVVKEWFSKK